MPFHVMQQLVQQLILRHVQPHGGTLLYTLTLKELETSPALITIR